MLCTHLSELSYFEKDNNIVPSLYKLAGQKSIKHFCWCNLENFQLHIFTPTSSELYITFNITRMFFFKFEKY